MTVDAARVVTRDVPRPAVGGATVGLLVLLFAALWFGGLGHRKLIKPDEGRYAEIPREMVATGDWLTPRLNGVDYFEKPPLQYWATAAAYEAFGVTEWTSRLWAALTGFAGVLVVGFTARRLYDAATGLVAATVLGSSLAYVLLAHFNTLDMGLTFFMTATLCAVLLARDVRARADGPQDATGHCGVSPSRAAIVGRRWMLVAWAALALAVLSKGPVAVLLAGGALVGYLAVARDWTLLRMLAPVRGVALFLLVAGPWFVAVSRANPGFAHFFFVHEHVERFLTTEHRREGPLWYFVPILVVGLLPWLTTTVAGTRARLATPARAGFAPERLLAAWCVLVFAFFSVSGSKLPSYILPMFPALALFVAPYLAGLDARLLKRHLVALALFIGCGCVAVLFLERMIDTREARDAVEAFRLAALASLLAWLVGTGGAIVLAARRRALAAIVVAGFAALVGWSGLMLGHEALGRGMSTYDIAQRIEAASAPDTTLYSIGLFEHSLDFYLGRTVVPVSFRDELDFGLTRAPERGIATYEAFAERWRAERAPLAIVSRDDFAKLARLHLAYRIVADDGRRIVIGKPPAGPAP